jgi:hypothetical protein
VEWNWKSDAVEPGVSLPSAPLARRRRKGHSSMPFRYDDKKHPGFFFFNPVEIKRRKKEGVAFKKNYTRNIIFQ